MLEWFVKTKQKTLWQLWNSFTKQGKFVRECNSKTAPIRGEIYASDLLKMRKLKNTDAA